MSEHRSRTWATPAAIAGILALAVGSQSAFGAFGDISWMLTLGERWLDGGRPYINFIETNPPASLLIYMPAVALARWAGVKAEVAIVAQGLLVGLAMLAACAAIARRGRLRAGPITFLVALVAVAILPGRTFDERDFFACLLGLPLLATADARASGARVGFAAAVIAGLGAGAMIAIKPPYAVMVLFIAPYVVAKLGWRSLLVIEARAAAALLFSYAAATWLWFPAYLDDVWPTVAAAYLPVRQTFWQLTANAGVVMTLALLGAAAALAGRGARAPLVATPMLAALGALAAYYLQGKGWLYHLYPAMALATLAVGAALDALPRAPREIVAAAGIGLLTYLGAAIGIPALPLGVGLLLAARFLVPGLGEGEMLPRLAVLTSGALIGAACGLFAAPFPGPSEAFLATLRALGPHPRLAAISEGLGAGFPLTREVGGVWAQRTQGMLMTAGARYLIDSHPGDAALASRLAPIIARDRDMVAQDIANNRPDAILLGRRGTRFAAWALADPQLKAALSDYRLAAENDGKDWPYDLYTRIDEIGLRPTLDDAP